MDVLAKSLSSLHRVTAKSCGYCCQHLTHYSSTTPTPTLTPTHACPTTSHSLPPTPAPSPTRRINRRTELDFHELRTLQGAGDIALIDVRCSQELENYGDIPGSLKIPLCQIKTALQLSEEDWIRLYNTDKPELQDRNLVFYARGPNASSAAVEIAHRLGFKRSRHYTGGWEDYCRNTGQPLKKTQDENGFGNYYSNFDQYFL
ncbi:Thiosulfate sulfurtransferase/rhodanese-like domain-containing protein 3 [Chionoecetes opilio]|uniref:Thiosulfate sulfurtransferase/rhodanese-like domain-containing protein 3 n=1 Tax=Chionoecetes opilio TaxID=41210 RepID=A0A8J4YJY5_CHIOP|nr:Thiosulfate sulfurtransferase/rhodanese-like domain-containing protein 3 [Chionoecetes opilio]